MTGSYRESSNQAKDVRRGVIDIRPSASKRKRSRKDLPFVVESRYIGKLLGWRKGEDAWRIYGRYSTEAVAQQVVATQARKRSQYFEYRSKPQEE